MNKEIELAILNRLAHTDGKSLPELYVSLGDAIVKHKITDLAKDYIYPLKDAGVLFLSRDKTGVVWGLAVEGYARLNAMSKEATAASPLTVASAEHFTTSALYRGEDLRPVAGRVGAFDYRKCPSRVGQDTVPYMPARSLGSAVDKQFHQLEQ